MSDIAPPRVANIETYWNDRPPELSPRCVWWVARINAGWRGNKRTRRLGYDSSAEYHGVYIWEWFNVIRPLLDKLAAEVVN